MPERRNKYERIQISKKTDNNAKKKLENGRTINVQFLSNYNVNEAVAWLVYAGFENQTGDGRPVPKQIFIALGVMLVVGLIAIPAIDEANARSDISY